MQDNGGSVGSTRWRRRARWAYDAVGWAALGAVWAYATYKLLGKPPWAYLEVEQMKEEDLEQAVKDLLAVYGLAEFSYHTHDSRRSTPGFPDWVIAGRGGVLFRELKSAEGRVSRAQNRWIMALKQSGQDVDVWRPADLKSGRITRELLALREGS